MNKSSSNQQSRRALMISRKVFSYPYLIFMLIFVVVPLVMILFNAFIKDDSFTLANFVTFFSQREGLAILGNSLVLGFATTIICLLLGYPVAYILARYHVKTRTLALLFIVPMWINFLIRTLAIKEIFMTLDVKLGMGTVLFGMIYNYLPFMILPLHTTLTSIDKSYGEAANDLGCDEVSVFARVTLPLSVPGIISGITMVFIPTISTFAISQYLSERTVMLFGDSIDMMFKLTETWGVGSVMSLVMLVLVIIANVLLNRFNKDTTKGGGLV
ncbi:MAG: ABC transporter permease [Clostridia bacterium]|nr:ABC transporter permease [Clostridia bacterium]